MNVKFRFFLFVLIFGIFTYISFSQQVKKRSEKFLIVLDTQEHITHHVLPEDQSRTFFKNLTTAITNTNPDKIIFVRSSITMLSLSVKGFKSSKNLNLKFDKRLKLLNNHVFIKDKYNAFYESEIATYFKKLRAKDIVIIGLMAEQSVFHTAMGAKDIGYNVYVIPEAIGAKSNESKMDIVNELKRSGVKIIQLKDL